MLNVFQTDLHNYFVSHAFGATAFAVYAIGCLQVPLVGILRESVALVLVSRVSALAYEGRSREILELTAGAMRKLSLFYAPCYAFLLVASYDVIVLMYTSTYAASAQIFRINLMLLPLSLFLTDPVVRANPGLSRYVVWVRLALLGVLIALLVLAIQHLGMIGAVAAAVVVVAMERLAVSWRTARLLGMEWRDWRLFSGMLLAWGLALAAAGITYGVRRVFPPAPLPVLLGASAAVFGTLYAGGVVGCGLLTREERRMIRGRVESFQSKLKRQKAQVKGTDGVG